jgi:hypothetical protein
MMCFWGLRSTAVTHGFAFGNILENEKKACDSCCWRRTKRVRLIYLSYRTSLVMFFVQGRRSGTIRRVEVDLLRARTISNMALRLVLFWLRGTAVSIEILVAFFLLGRRKKKCDN